MKTPLTPKHSRVRRRPRTGLGNAHRTNKGVVYFGAEWLDVTVVILKRRQYRDMVVELERRQRVINKIGKMLNQRS